MGTTWSKVADDEDGSTRPATPTARSHWTGTRVDLVFGSNSELRAVAEVYA